MRVPCALIAVDHNTAGIGDCGTHSLLHAQPLKTLVALLKYDALHPAPARHQLDALAQKGVL